MAETTEPVPVSDAEGLARPKKGDLNQSVYLALKELILSGRLRPGGRLIHQELADYLDVSRTPVREALERLYQEGYAGRRSRRGYYVAELDTSDVRDLYGTREALELYAYDLTCKRGFQPAEIKRLDALNTKYAKMFPDAVTRERLQLDREFHLTLASFSGNNYLCEMLESVFEKTELKRRLDGFGMEVKDEPIRDHQALMAAIHNEKYREGARVLRKHIQSACVRLITHLEKNSDFSSRFTLEGLRRPRSAR